MITWYEKKINVKDENVDSYFISKIDSYRLPHNEYFNKANNAYHNIHKFLYKNQFLSNVNVSKYKLPEKACHPELNEIRYPKL